MINPNRILQRIGSELRTLLGDAEMQAWGWRIPFFAGAAIAFYALLLRRGLTDDGDPEP